MEKKCPITVKESQPSPEDVWNRAVYDTILDPGNILGDEFKKLLSDLNKDPELLESPEFNQRIRAIANNDPLIAEKLESRKKILSDLLDTYKKTVEIPQTPLVTDTLGYFSSLDTNNSQERKS